MPPASVPPYLGLAVDKWHLVALANQMVTEARQRVTRDQLGRRGTTADPVWVNRRLLLTGADHLTAKQWARLSATLERCDPTNEIGAAWGVEERLRDAAQRVRAVEDPLAAGRLLRRRPRRGHARDHPAREHHPNPAASDPGRPHREPHHARTEGLNRIIKQTKRVGCGYRNLDNYQRRILSHIAVTRPQKSAT